MTAFVMGKPTSMLMWSGFHSKALGPKLLPSALPSANQITITGLSLYLWEQICLKPQLLGLT